ncbi:hypothetical protein Sste5346_006400 [Sporothrix stenoceras]|uniref:Zinc finger PHD-type domain-containing protein n=1 Tax=Sporothrix stenoceras TaxID=5173 RepID=A0ABR3YZT3_9PEZI
MDVDAPEAPSGDDAKAVNGTADGNGTNGAMNGAHNAHDAHDAMEIDKPQPAKQEEDQQSNQKKLSSSVQRPPSSSSSPPASPSPPPPPPVVRQIYTPQFSPAMAKLIHGEGGDSLSYKNLAKHGVRTISLGIKSLSPEELSQPRTMPMPVSRKSPGPGPGPRKRRQGTPNTDSTISDFLEDQSTPSLSPETVQGPLCTVCDRPARSIFNPLVPCRRCGQRWHRLCHDPVIADYVAAASAATTDGAAVNNNSTPSPASPADAGPSSSAGGWSCPSCVSATTAETTARLARRARAVRPANSLSLPTRPPPPAHHDVRNLSRQQRHNYLAGLSRPDLQKWLLYAMEKNPEVAVFPPRPPPIAVTTAAAVAATSTTVAAGAAPRRGRPPRSMFLPPLPAGMAPPHGGRVTAAAVMSATKNSQEYRDRIVRSIRKGHAELVAEAERRERAEKMAQGLHVPRRRGRPRKASLEAAAAHQARLAVQAALAQQPVSAQQIQAQPTVTRPAHLRQPQTHPPSASQMSRTHPPQPASQSVKVVKAMPTSPSHIPAFEPTPVDPDEEDPMGLMAGWPKPGQGLYARVGPDWDTSVNGDDGNSTGRALISTNDHASFSSMVFNAAGRKVIENGAPVLAL